MLWIIIGLIVFIVSVVKIFIDGWFDLVERFLVSFLILICTAGITLIVLLISSGLTSAVAEVDYNMVSDTKIIALKDNQNVSGNFYIMGGYIDEDLYYYYATETQFGYKTEKVKAESAYIKYTSEETHIEKYEPEFKNDFAYLF